jgi:hypothetical protein
LARLVRRTPRGSLRVEADADELARAAAELAAPLAAAGAKGLREVELAGAAAVLKSSPLHGRSALRWGLKRALFGARLPRLAERRNLSWLRSRLFAAPEPLAAGALIAAGVPRWQFLVTRRVERATPLQEWLPRAPPAERAAVLDEIAREVARMHALHFVHRDLWPRNLLVVPAGGLSRVWFLDCWAGGPGPGWRGPAHDLACFERGAGALLEPGELERWQARYAAELRALAPPRPGAAPGSRGAGC